MPELPEVETSRRGIEPYLTHQTVAEVTLRQARLRIPVPNELPGWCVGQTITSVTRRGKYLILHLTDGWLFIHLGMSGHLKIHRQFVEPQKHDHIDLCLTNGTILRYTDPRRFGLWQYTRQNPFIHPLLIRLGPEPLSDDFNPAYLKDRARDKRQSIKSFLMDNQVVVGVGNIYATESLHLANIHPVKPAGALTLEQLKLLVAQVKRVLENAITAGGTTLKDFFASNGKPGYFAQQLHAYGRDGLGCFQCNETLQSIIISGRRSTFCPNCQN